jgi:HTH-type transcriptional repressor of NAD biosynthesis genes
MYITKSYSNFLLGDIPKWPYWAYESSDMDLRIFLKSDAPYVNDGTRLNKEDRLLLEKSHLKTYEDAGIFPKVFSYNGSYDKRFEDIVYYIDTFLTNL